jgi:hypothetical protein
MIFSFPIRNFTKINVVDVVDQFGYEDSDIFFILHHFFMMKLLQIWFGKNEV